MRQTKTLQAVWITIAFSMGLCLSVESAAQGTPADYARAAGLEAKYEAAAIDVAGPATWIGKTDRFWYRKQSRGNKEFIVVDAQTLKKQPAFDHEKIAASLSKVTGKTYKAQDLPFRFIRFDDTASSFFTFVDGSPLRCTVADSVCKKLAPGERGVEDMEFGPPRRQEGPRVSADGKWEALIDNFNVAIRPAGSHELTHLSTDGSEGDYYTLSSIVWSPDSKKLAAYRMKPGYHREVHYVESSPQDQIQPKFFSRPYEKPGDVLDLNQPALFDLAAKKQIDIDNQLFPNPYELSDLVWHKDSRAFTFEYNQRGHQIYRIIEVDATSGKPRVVISE